MPQFINNNFADDAQQEDGRLRTSPSEGGLLVDGSFIQFTTG